MNIRTGLLPLVFIVVLHAHATVLPDACGDDRIQFNVKTEKSQPALAPPESGKAQIVFIENYTQNEGFCIECKVTTRIGVDGAWAGANHGNSYFAYSIDPGEHHLCVDWQSQIGSLRQKVGLASLNAQAGAIYYYQIKVRIRQYENTNEKYLELAPLDPDQGKYLVKINPLANAIAKK